MAVGHYTNSSGTQVTLSERWDGTSWTIVSTPNAVGAQSSTLLGVSCTAANACTAAGSYKNSSGVTVTLVERWDGTSWTIQASPNPAGASSSALSGVSCVSSSACVAVGQYTNSSGVQVTLAEHWNGASWSIQATPNPAGATASRLAGGVSCTSANSCTAVGNYINSSGTTVTLAERWNGSSWTTQTTPNPAGATNSILTGVSCAGDPCTAVGQYTNSIGTKFTLAELYEG
jgi:hypothetical protein